MVSIIDFLPIITILAVGAGLWQILNRIFSCNFRITEYFNVFLLLGSFSLIIPLTWIGIQPNGTLILAIGRYSIDLINFSGWCLTYMSVGLIIAMIGAYYLLRRLLANLEEFRFDSKILKDYRIILLGFLLVDYFILEVILPLRGFDALYYYFPEAEVFYQAGRITEINYLSFLPVVKSPLNVLVYVYSYYVTGELSVQLFPFLFLFGLVLLVYDFSLELFNDRSLALIAAIFTLTLPFTYWLMNYWAFYQDLYLCYFFSVTCYFSLKLYKSPSKPVHGLFMVIGIITSLLTKITAWILPIILILWLPTGLKGKLPRLVIIIAFGIFLCAQAATRMFIGVILAIIGSLGAVIYFIVKEKPPDYNTRTYLQVIPISIGIVIGSFWLSNRISLMSSVREEIYNLYFHISRTIMWDYPTQSGNPLLHTLENVHGVTFISAIGILFLGSVFVLPWGILKIFSLKNFRPITAPLIWILVFFGIWSTYYLDSSIRYLAPIITPMILCVSWGFYQLTKKINSKVTQDFIGIFFALLGCLSFYYLIPLKSLTITGETQETIGLSYNQAALDYYSHPIYLIILALGINVLILAVIRKDLVIQLISNLEGKINIIRMKNLLQKLTHLINSLKINYLRGISRVLIVGAIVIPLVVQGYLILYTQGNMAEFHAINEYEYRDEYQELVTVIQQQNQPLAVILTVRTPGLQFFSGQPVIDIYYQRSLFQGDPFFKNTNLTQLIAILQNPLPYIVETDFNIDLNASIGFIVVPSVKNLYYKIYIKQIQRKSVLFQSLEVNSSFSLIYNNSDYLLYEVDF